MWKRKELKNKAKKVVHKNYWTAILVCFIIALLTGEFGTSIIGIWNDNDKIDSNYIFNIDAVFEKFYDDNNIKENKIFSKENIKNTLNGTQTKILEAIEANFNSALKAQKYILKIWDAIKSFNINKTELGIMLCISATIALTFTIFIADPLIVGGKKYFIKIQKGKNAKVGTITEVFKKDCWMNISITMFLRNIYTALWYLTIIGGIIKTYEYRMIPYILADNPKIKRKEAFALSKQMMKGNKWQTFILDMSFFGWNFLSVLTAGILSILYVNPYNSATLAELYYTLKEKAIKEKYEYYEKIK